MIQKELTCMEFLIDNQDSHQRLSLTLMVIVMTACLAGDAWSRMSMHGREVSMQGGNLLRALPVPLSSPRCATPWTGPASPASSGGSWRPSLRRTTWCRTLNITNSSRRSEPRRPSPQPSVVTPPVSSGRGEGGGERRVCEGFLLKVKNDPCGRVLAGILRSCVRGWRAAGWPGWLSRCRADPVQVTTNEDDRRHLKLPPSTHTHGPRAQPSHGVSGIPAFPSHKHTNRHAHTLTHAYS